MHPELSESRKLAKVQTLAKKAIACVHDYLKDLNLYPYKPSKIEILQQTATANVHGVLNSLNLSPSKSDCNQFAFVENPSAILQRKKT